MENLDKRLARVESRLDQHSAKHDEHTAKLDDLSAKIDGHTAILDEHSAKLDEHTAILEEHTVKLNEHSAKLDRIEARQLRQDDLLSDLIKGMNVSYERMDRFERLIEQVFVHIDLRFETLRSDMRAFKDELADHGRRIPALEQTTAQHGKQQKALSKKVSALEKRVS